MGFEPMMRVLQTLHCRKGTLSRFFLNSGQGSCLFFGTLVRDPTPSSILSQQT
jgi:hypothetical protein